MTNGSDPAKRKIAAKYDAEALEKDTADWLRQGDSERVPESKSAHYFIDRKVKEALALCGEEVSRNSHALEIGCSFGHMTSLLCREFDRVTAVDISPESIRVAEKRLRHYRIDNVRFLCDDAETLATVTPNSFDVVFSFSTIRFCEKPQKAMDAIFARLKPGGLAIIDFPNRLSPWHLWMKPALGINRHIHDHLYSTAEAVKLFTNAGFEVGGVRRFLFTSRRLPALFLPVFKIVDFVFGKIPPFPALAGIIMVKGRKP